MFRLICTEKPKTTLLEKNVGESISAPYYLCERNVIRIGDRQENAEGRTGRTHPDKRSGLP